MMGKEKNKKAHMLEVCKIMLKLPVRLSSPTLIPNARTRNTAKLQANSLTYLEAKKKKPKPKNEKKRSIQNKSTITRYFQYSHGNQ